MRPSRSGVAKWWICPQKQKWAWIQQTNTQWWWITPRVVRSLVSIPTAISWPKWATWCCMWRKCNSRSIASTGPQLKQTFLIWFHIYCRASHTGDAIRAMYSSVRFGVVHVLCTRASAEHSVMFLVWCSCHTAACNHLTTHLFVAFLRLFFWFWFWFLFLFLFLLLLLWLWLWFSLLLLWLWLWFFFVFFF